MSFVEYVIISINQLENRGRTSIKKIINLYIIAAQNNKDCAVCTNKNPKTQKGSGLCLYWLTWFKEIRSALMYKYYG